MAGRLSPCPLGGGRHVPLNCSVGKKVQLGTPPCKARCGIWAGALSWGDAEHIPLAAAGGESELNHTYGEQ